MHGLGIETGFLLKLLPPLSPLPPRGPPISLHGTVRTVHFASLTGGVPEIPKKGRTGTARRWPCTYEPDPVYIGKISISFVVCYLGQYLAICLLNNKDITKIQIIIWINPQGPYIYLVLIILTIVIALNSVIDTLRP